MILGLKHVNWVTWDSKRVVGGRKHVIGMILGPNFETRQLGDLGLETGGWRPKTRQLGSRTHCWGSKTCCCGDWWLETCCRESKTRRLGNLGLRTGVWGSKTRHWGVFRHDTGVVGVR